ncbi:MAG TPA: metalloregulator ArsR/SmtB family transcription factor [Polyangiaceae bacterium]|nr:metalloregulator ArsR/SmtB family transcription factor [Polyangiaceae bacterium]
MLETFSALAEPNRLRIVALLRAGPRPVGEISHSLKLRQPQVSKHLHLLRAAGVVAVRPVAQQRVYELSPAAFHKLQAWLEEYRALWDARFDALDGVIAELKQRDKKESARHERRKKN